ncbi:MAG: DNA polymerase III subunit epsilon [Elusimicrobia bacterium]|nr:MAG: DNA polymerase III subunit epsilon [Elusimicrobiota bacterium]
MPSSARPAERLGPGKPLSEVAFAVLDTETTGLSPKYGGRVCEVAVVVLKGGRETARWTTLLDPQCRIDAGALAVHGITQAMVAGQPTFAEVADDLDGLLTGAVLVAHNAPFDVSFLSSEYARIGRVMPAVPVLCTLKLARRHFKFPSNKLGSIASALGVGQSVAHRALADTEALGGIFSHFLREFEKKGVTTLEGLLTL